jgi:chemosensory pili system protein ChpA (sensor histidine kinase/response regulator)
MEEQLPDVMLLDIEMPRMDGYELVSHVRKHERLQHIPIVMITSRVGDKHRAHGLALGVNDYLGKPYQEAQLLAALAPFLKQRRRA